MKYLFYSLLLVLTWSACVVKNRSETSSPNKQVKVVFMLDAQGRPGYQAFYKEKMVLDTSWMGFELNGANPLKNSFELVNTKLSSFNETWEQPWGEEQFIKNNYSELRIQLQEKLDLKRKLDIVFRVYDDGFGFRYEFPEQENLRNFEIINELTEFRLTADHDSWSIPAYQPDQYEYLYRKLPASKMGKIHTPVTFMTADKIYLSIHEAAIQDYSSMVIDPENSTRLKCDLVPYSKTEKTRAFVSAPGKTPWRTVQLASSPGDLITSYLILNLNEPSQIPDIQSWFTPGKYIGIWWEMHIGKSTWASGPTHGATTANTKSYIDFAAKHGFDGVLAEGWNIGWDGNWAGNGSDFSFTQAHPDFDLPQISQYAQEKGVSLIGHHETAGNIDNYEQQITGAFDLLDKYGMKTVKTGYVEQGNILTNGKYHHGQAFIDHFHKVIRLAAQHQITVVAHEPIKDGGERRTYPNMISREGARGQEFNAWSSDGGNPPDHETILPFTRCLAGPMDFTPGVFDISIPSKATNQVNTTLVKQLALYVTIYSPVQMACDLPAHYEKYPDAFEFIKEVGVDWETTKVLDAEIGEHITIARKERNTGNWFIGSVTDENVREVTIKFDFLDPGQTYQAKIYKDGENAHYKTMPESYMIETRTIKAGDSYTAKLAASGGLAVSMFKLKS